MAEPVQVVVDSAAIQNFYYIVTMIGAVLAALAAYARSIQVKIDKDIADLAAYKTHVAAEYVSVSRFDNMTKQILDSIKEFRQELGGRLDGMMNRQQPTQINHS